MPRVSTLGDKAPYSEIRADPQFQEVVDIETLETEVTLDQTARTPWKASVPVVAASSSHLITMNADVIGIIRADGSSADDVRMENSDPGLLSRYRDLVHRACDVFGDDTRASVWLSTPNEDLAGQVPLKVAEEDNYSPARLEPLFVRLEHGIDF